MYSMFFSFSELSDGSEEEDTFTLKAPEINMGKKKFGKNKNSKQNLWVSR